MYALISATGGESLHSSRISAVLTVAAPVPFAVLPWFDSCVKAKS
jgi:hypothetical protein